MLNFTHQHHEEFMDKLKVEYPEEAKGFDIVKFKCWHFKFSPDSIPEIPMADLKPVPESQARASSVSEMMGNRSIRNSLVNQAFTAVAAEQEGISMNKSIFTEKEREELSQTSRRSGLPLELLQKIKAKEQAELRYSMLQKS